MRAARAVTLLEVLAATVLLTVVVSACLPILTCLHSRTFHGEELRVEELASAADRVVADPTSFGLDPSAEWNKSAATSIRVGGSVGTVVVSVRAARPSGERERADHLWLVFEAEGVAVSRWARTESENTPP